MDIPEVQPDFTPGPTTCPAATNCRNAGAWCTACVWPEAAVAPSYYVPQDPREKIPAIEARKNARRRARQAARRSDAAQRGRRSRAKGARVEREFARLTGGQRVPLSGALRGTLTNDVQLPPALGGLRVEVKARKDGAGFKQLLTWLFDAEEKPDALVLKADGYPFLVVQTYEQWAAGRQPTLVDLAKLTEAKRLLEEALACTSD